MTAFLIPIYYHYTRKAIRNMASYGKKFALSLTVISRVVAPLMFTPRRTTLTNIALSYPTSSPDMIHRDVEMESVTPGL
ncbi:unnamed protein product [Leptosia nina]|uniref:Uncharacterized protein n=1 Tax=Leptosia nina TaxID=320188 RepID=A0AAV1JT79_9NEOP